MRKETFHPSHFFRNKAYKMENENVRASPTMSVLKARIAFRISW